MSNQYPSFVKCVLPGGVPRRCLLNLNLFQSMNATVSARYGKSLAITSEFPNLVASSTDLNLTLGVVTQLVRTASQIGLNQGSPVLLSSPTGGGQSLNGQLNWRVNVQGLILVDEQVNAGYADAMILHYDTGVQEIITIDPANQIAGQDPWLPGDLDGPLDLFLRGLIATKYVAYNGDYTDATAPDLTSFGGIIPVRSRSWP